MDAHVHFMCSGNSTQKAKTTANFKASLRINEKVGPKIYKTLLRLIFELFVSHH
jgi:hypothetical protein